MFKEIPSPETIVRQPYTTYVKWKRNTSVITFIIDDLSQCLIEANTGDIVETEVLRVTRKSFLQKFNKNYRMVC